MKNLFAVLLVALFTTGCATTGYENTVTGATGGGLLGAGIVKATGGSASKGAVAGALLGAGIGVFADHQERKDNERAEKIGELIYNKTGGGNDSGAAQSASTAEANLAFAEGKRRECEAEYGTYKKNGVRIPHDCEAEFRQALADAKYTADTNSPEVTHAVMRGGGGQYYNGVRLGSRHASYWLGWGPAGTARYNRQNGYYR